MGTTTVPPHSWELNPDANLPQKTQSVLVIAVTSAVLSFLAIEFYWSLWSHMPRPPRTPFEASFFYIVGPVVLFLNAYGLSFLWFGMSATGAAPGQNPMPLLRAYAWAVLGIAAGSVLFNEALTTPRGLATKLCYMIAGSALLAESVVLVHLIQTRKSATGQLPRHAE